MLLLLLLAGCLACFCFSKDSFQLNWTALNSFPKLCHRHKSSHWDVTSAYIHTYRYILPNTAILVHHRHPATANFSVQQWFVDGNKRHDILITFSMFNVWLMNPFTSVNIVWKIVCVEVLGCDVFVCVCVFVCGTDMLKHAHLIFPLNADVAWSFKENVLVLFEVSRRGSRNLPSRQSKEITIFFYASLGPHEKDLTLFLFPFSICSHTNISSVSCRNAEILLEILFFSVFHTSRKKIYPNHFKIKFCKIHKLETFHMRPTAFNINLFLKEKSELCRFCTKKSIRRHVAKCVNLISIS